MPRNQFFYIKFDKFMPLGYNLLLNDEAKDVFIIEIILLLQDIDKGFDHIIDIARHIG